MDPDTDFWSFAGSICPSETRGPVSDRFPLDCYTDLVLPSTDGWASLRPTVSYGLHRSSNALAGEKLCLLRHGSVHKYGRFASPQWGGGVYRSPNIGASDRNSPSRLECASR